MATLSLVTLLILSIAQPVTAMSTVDCGTTPELEPLLEFIETIQRLAITFGLSLATLSLAAAGIVYTWGGRDAQQRAKERVRRVIIGVLIIMAAPTIVSFLAGQFAGCGGL